MREESVSGVPSMAYGIVRCNTTSNGAVYLVSRSREPSLDRVSAPCRASLSNPPADLLSEFRPVRVGSKAAEGLETSGAFAPAPTRGFR